MQGLHHCTSRNQALEDMQAMKARAVEHARYRTVGAPTDPSCLARIARMREAAVRAALGRDSTEADSADTWA
eukprot:15447021-Alexandrium_andersonii.AAC.1